MELLDDIDKETVPFIHNFDGQHKEPTVLPSKMPNLLVNGSSGIAVGHGHQHPAPQPPRGRRGVQGADRRPRPVAGRLQALITGPDFPTGGYICGREGIQDAYRTGRGRVVMRAKADIEQIDANSERIVVTEIPFMVNKSRLIEQIAQLARDKKIPDIRDLRDESDRDGMRIVIELKRDAVPYIVLNRLYKHTQMQSTFGTILLALVDGQPQVMTLREMLHHFIEHRHTVIVKRSEFDLAKAKDREHILEGLKIAVDNIDEVIKVIRGAPDTDTASTQLQERFELSERQAKAILDMRLARLTGLEIEKLEAELAEVRATIAELESILASREKRMGILKDELQEMADKFGDERRTEIIGSVGSFDIEDLIVEEDMVITVSHQGYVKRLPGGHLPRAAPGWPGPPGHGHQGRGLGRAPLRGVHPRLPHDLHPPGPVLLDQGVGDPGGRAGVPRQAHREPVEPRVRRADRRGGPGAGVRRGQVPAVLHPQGRHQADPAQRVRERARGGPQRHQRPRGRRAHRGGRSPRARTRSSWPRGRAWRSTSWRATPARWAGPPRACAASTWRSEDVVVGMAFIRPESTLLVVTENGMGKRTQVDAYRLQRRGGKGVINIKTSEKTGQVVSIKSVTEDEQLMVITQKGVVNRQRIDEIRVIGRATQGVRLVNLDDGDEVMDVARVIADDEVDVLEEGLEGVEAELGDVADVVEDITDEAAEGEEPEGIEPEEPEES